MNKKRRIAIILAVIAAYIVLAVVLQAVESASPDASITSVPMALWYTLTTMTTVGYGDVYPVTVAGKIIGAVFQFASLGLLVFLIGLAIAALREKLPKLRLRSRRRAPWYIFTAQNSRSETLARGILAEDPEAVIVFSGAGGKMPGTLAVDLAPADITAFHQGMGPSNVFCLKDPFVENEIAAQTLADTPAEVYCLTDYDLPARPGLSVFDPYSGCARLYWHQYPAASPREKIVLIGEGKYAEALLEKALQQNVIAVPGRMEYRIFGDFSGFRRLHPYLDRAVAVCCEGSPDPNRDSLIFSAKPWDADFDLLCRADRIVICYDDEAQALETLADLRRYVPVSCPVYARLSADLEGVIVFGREEEIFSPELVMHKKLDEMARGLHESYLADQPGSDLPSWEELTGFVRDSNRAAADHLELKVRILLEDEARRAVEEWPADPAAGAASGEEPEAGVKATPVSGSAQAGSAGLGYSLQGLTPEVCRKAYEFFCQADGEARTRYRRIEHERWMRFHILHNWQYALVRDNGKRRHPLMVPFDELTPEDQAKDDYGWELLGQLGNRG